MTKPTNYKKFADKHNIINIDYKDLILDLKDMYNCSVSTASIWILLSQ